MKDVAGDDCALVACERVERASTIEFGETSQRGPTALARDACAGLIATVATNTR